jgi:hypothetical protein
MMKKCMQCNVPMKKTTVLYKGLSFEAQQCPKCKEKIFTEDLAMQAITKMEAKKLKEEYIKKSIKIGNSIGMTFPKELIEVFGLDKSTLRIHPKVKEGKIEISVVN